MSYMSEDDDLFEYDPDQEDTIQTEVKQDYSTSNLGDQEKELIESIKDHFDASEGSVKGVETILAQSFFRAFTETSLSFKESSTYRATKYILDELSQGRFSLLEYFYVIESKIAHKVFFLELCDSVFDEEQTYSSVVKEIFDIELSDIHIKTIYHPAIKIIRHTLNIDKATYLQLSEELGMPVKMSLFEDKLDDIDLDDYSYSKFLNKINNNIDNDLVSRGLLDKVIESFGTDVRYNQT